MLASRSVKVITMKKICLLCSVEFEVKQSEINRGNGKFCSHSCRTKNYHLNKPPKEKPEPNVQCAYCKVMFYKTQYALLNGSKSGLYFCCREHKDNAQKIGGFKEIMPPHYGIGDPKNIYRRKALANKKAQCERCGYNQNPAAIVVHHKDRNRMNDSLDNLEVLCANCHAAEHWGESK